MALFERADTGKKVSWASLIGLILIPLIIAGGFVAATWKVSDRMDSVKAVIVNDDDGAKVNGQDAPLGRQLVGGIMDDDTSGNYQWVLSDKKEAEDGMKSGEYVAAIYIPKDFSENVTSGSDQDNADKAVQATISVTTSKASPLSDGAISTIVGNAARDKFNREYTEQYLNGIYLGFNKMGKGYSKLAKGAQGLANGNKKYAKGIDGLGEGVTQLGGAGGKLAKGGKDLGSAGGQLAANAPQLKKGGDKLGKGGKALAKNAPQLKKGGDKLGKGGKALAKNWPKLKKGGDELGKNGDKIADGVDEYSDGVRQYTKQTDKLIEGLAQGGSQIKASDLRKAGAGTKQYTDGISKYQSGIAKQADGLKKVPDLNTAEQSGAITKKQAQEGRDQCGNSNPDCEQAFLKGMSSGIKGDAAKAKPLADNGAKLGKNDKALFDGVAKLVEGLNGISDNSDQLLAGSKKLRGAGDKAAKGVHQYAGGVSKYTDGVSQFGDGAAQLGGGVGKYTDGVGQFADGVQQYGNGVGQYTDGVGKFADGVAKFGGGVAKYTGGVAQYTGGVQKLADGMPQLQKGAHGLADGNQKFADGIKDAKDSVPHYSKDDRKALKKNASSPIKVSNVDALNKLPIAPTVALLLIMSLWLGALITYTVVRGVSASSLTSRKRSVVIMLKGLIPGLAVSIIQALGLTALCQLLFKSDVVDFMSVLGFSMFAGITYTVVNFALVALFGGTGRFISVALLALGVAANIISAVPGWLSGLANISPVTYGINGVTSIVTGADGLGKAFGLLLVWLIAGAVASIAAVARKRSAGFNEIQKMAHA